MDFQTQEEQISGGNMDNGMFIGAAALTVFLLVFCFVGLGIVHYKTTKEKKLEKKKASEASDS